MPRKPGFDLPPTQSEARQIWRNKQRKDTMQFEADMKEAAADQQRTDSLGRGFRTLKALTEWQKNNAEKIQKAKELRKEQERLERLKKSG